MIKPCADCPFTNSKGGTNQRRALHPSRMREIKRALRHDQHFLCHKTTHETGDGSNKLCAGALQWQHDRNLTSNYERVCERLDAMSKGR